MKLNLGCGGTKLEGWVNIDRNPGYEPDVIADVRQLPFSDGEVEEIFASHILEHFGYEENVLGEWSRVLCPGGRITVIVPDVESVYAAWEENLRWPFGGNVDVRTINGFVFGATAWGGEFLEDADNQTHRQIFLGVMLLERMREYFPDAYEFKLDGVNKIVRGTKPKTPAGVPAHKADGGKA